MIHPDPPPELPPDALDEGNLYFDHFSTPPLQNPDTYTSVTINEPPTTTPPVEGNPGTVLNPISIHSSTPPPGVDQDSRMNSPESEESTHPAVPPAGAETHHGRLVLTRVASQTPRSGLTFPKNPHPPTPDHPPASLPPPPAPRDTNLLQAVAGGAMPPPLSIQASNAKYGAELTSSLNLNHEDQIVGFEANDQTLKEEFTREINDVVMGFSQYYLTGLLQFRFDNDFSFRQENLQTAVLLTLQALDTSTAFKEGETSVSILTPQAWHRLVMAVLAAIIRGHLCSPGRATNGNKSLNWSTDSFVVSPDIPKPLSEGGAIRSMALQLAGYYDTKRSNPLHTSPEEFFSSLVEKQTYTLQRITSRTAQPHQEIQQDITRNEQEMEQIRNKVKESIFQTLNAEALNDLDTWREIYHEEFKEVMQRWIASNNFSSPDACFIKPDIKQKSRAKSVTPEQEINITQIEELVRTDCQVQIDVMRRELLNDMKTSMEKEIATLRSDELTRAHAETLANIQAETATFKALEFERLKAMAIQQVDADIMALKAQYTTEHEAYVRNKHNKVRKDLKAWKVRHTNSRGLALLQAEAKKLGYDLVANSPDAFKPNSDPDLAEEDWLPSSRATSRASSRAHSVERQAPTTPPLAPLRTDPNVTPTPVRIKRVQTDDLQEPQSDITIKLPPLPDTPVIPNTLFPTYAIPEPDPLPPAERLSLNVEDHMVQDHPLDVLQAHLSDNGGIHASMHAITRDTETTRPQDVPTFSTPLEAPSPPAAPPAEESELMAMMKMVLGTISRLEAQVNAQDTCIADFIQGKNPKAG
ncbi:hypothetical protein H4582DRAFT_2142045 [Lactarius indigo]|nr:hypothetical protein H4582DRAFT_2142045 [Lactarius indigo]